MMPKNVNKIEINLSNKCTYKIMKIFFKKVLP